MTWSRKKITTKIHLLIIIQTSMKTYIDTKLHDCRNSKIGRGAVFFRFKPIELKTVIEHVVYLNFFLYFPNQIHFFILSDPNPFFLYISIQILFFASYFDRHAWLFLAEKKVQTDMHIHVQSEYRLITKYVRWAPNIANDIYWFGSCFSMLIVRLKLLHCYLPLNQSANAKLNVNLYAIYYVAMY